MTQISLMKDWTKCILKQRKEMSKGTMVVSDTKNHPRSMITVGSLRMTLKDQLGSGLWSLFQRQMKS